MLVRDMMNPSPATVSPSDKLGRALKIMAELKERHVGVVDETERVVGIVSDRDLAMFYDPVNMTEGKWDEAVVSQIMSDDLMMIGSSADIHAASQMLLKSAISALPVVDNGTLIGILSEKDFVRHFARSDS